MGIRHAKFGKPTHAWALGVLYLLGVFTWQPCLSNENPSEVFLKDCITSNPAKLGRLRVTITRSFDNGVEAARSTTLVDMAADGSCSALAYSPDNPEQQTWWFQADGVQTYYTGAEMSKDGQLVPSIKQFLIHSTVAPVAGPCAHLAAQALQLDILASAPKGMTLGPDGVFTGTNITTGAKIRGRVDLASRFVERLVREDLTGSVTELLYTDRTNVGGVVLPTRLKIKSSWKGMSSESYVEFSFAALGSPLNARKYLSAPLGASVTDERFAPALNYYAEKESYTDQDLAQMWREQQKNKGALPSTPGKGNPLRSLVKVIMISIAVLSVLGVSLFFWASWQQSRGAR